MRTWPLVGRRAELKYLSEAIADPARRGVFLAGAAGVGKTRLLAEVVAQAETFHIERVTATRSAQPLPFGPLTHLLPETSPADSADLFASIGRGLTARADGRAAILTIDDAHLLDPRSAAFVHHATTSGLAKAIVCVRSGEPAPDAIHALYRDDVLPRLELQPISRPDFDTLVGEVLDGQVHATTLERLWEVAAGNVLYIRELILDAVEAGTLRREKGLWRWTGSAGNAPRLREMVLGRMGNLPQDQRRMVDLLAIGEPISVTMLNTLVPEAGLDAAERDGLVAVSTDGRRIEARLGHPLFGEALLRALPTNEQRNIRITLANALEATGSRRREDVLRLATWRLAAGVMPSVQVLSEATGQALDLSDFELAERLAREAVAQGGGLEVQVHLGRALTELGRYQEAEDVLGPILQIDDIADAVLQSAVDAMVVAVGHGQGRFDDAIQILVDAEARAESAQGRALLRAHRAALLSFNARFGEAAVVGASALEILDDDAIRLRSIASVGSSMVMAGRIDQALAFNDELLGPALRLQEQLPRAPQWVIGNRSTALILSGRFDEALALGEFALEAAGPLSPHAHAVVTTYQGRIALAQGKPATAKRLLTEASAILPPRGFDVPAFLVLSWLAEAHALLGDAAGARRTADEATRCEESGYLAFDVDARRARAWASVAEGKTTQAIKELTEAADAARDRGQVIFEVIILGDVLLIGDESVDRRAAAVAASADGHWAHAIGGHAAAVIENDPSRFEVAAGAFEAMGSRLVAAELMAIASTRLRDDGLRARSTAARRRAEDLLKECEGARSYQLADRAQPAPLSRREREVTMMAAKGKTNAEIANELHLSTRTVESHIYSAFGKLGISDRKDLAGMLDATNPS